MKVNSSKNSHFHHLQSGLGDEADAVDIIGEVEELLDVGGVGLGIVDLGGDDKLLAIEDVNDVGLGEDNTILLDLEDGLGDGGEVNTLVEAEEVEDGDGLAGDGGLLLNNNLSLNIGLVGDDGGGLDVLLVVSGDGLDVGDGGLGGVDHDGLDELLNRGVLDQGLSAVAPGDAILSVVVVEAVLDGGEVNLLAGGDELENDLNLGHGIAVVRQ